MSNSERIQAIKQRLEQALTPTELRVIDDSHKHVGHPGAKDGRGHFTVEIASKQLDEVNAIEAHRLVYQALGKLMQTDIHALTIKKL